MNLYVRDLAESLRFYRDVLGFVETFRVPKVGEPDHVELRLGPFTLGLATFGALLRDHGIRTGRGPARAEIALFTHDVDGAYGWATSNGAVSVNAPRDFGGYLRRAVIADPDGNPVVFTTRLPVTTSAAPDRRPTFTNHLYNVYADSIEGARHFYRDLLGSTETFRTPSGGAADHVEMELGPLNLAVSTLEALQRHHGLSGGGGPPRGEVVVWVDDVDAALAWLNARKVATVSPPHQFAGILRAAWVSDPDGNPVQLVARSGAHGPPRGPPARRGRRDGRRPLVPGRPEPIPAKEHGISVEYLRRR